MRLVAGFLLLLILAGCGGSPQFSPLPDNATLLAFGNSLTYGTGVKHAESYPSQLSALTGLKVINEGVPGELSAEGLARLPGLLDKHKPDLLILIHGGNDMLRKKDLEVASNNIRKMIQHARDRVIDVVMMAVPNPTLLLSPAGFYEEIANDMNVPIEVDAISDILQYPSNKSDAVHPNAKGYRKMALAIKTLLEDNGAL